MYTPNFVTALNNLSSTTTVTCVGDFSTFLKGTLYLIRQQDYRIIIDSHQMPIELARETMKFFTGDARCDFWSQTRAPDNTEGEKLMKELRLR